MRKTTGDIFTLHLCNTNSHMMYGSRDKRDRQNFLTFWTNFCPFTPLTTLKIKILKKWKKTPGDIILHMCTIKCDRQNFFSFWSIFYPFTNLTTQKIKILNKWKKTNKQKTLEISSFLHKCTIIDTQLLYMEWFLRYGAWQTGFFVILDYILSF